jgi:hypothetical protein
MVEDIILYKESSWNKNKFETSDVAGMVFFDDEDLTFLKQWTWYLSASGYAIRIDPYRHHYHLARYSMHVEIMRHHGHDLKGKVVDHKDRDRLNNQKSNLRVSTILQNNQNKAHRATDKSPFKGVKLHKDGKYHASIRLTIDLGVYSTAEEAREAYLDMAYEIYEEFVNSENKK